MAIYENKVIDVHTHLFNLRYLPIWGVLTSRGVPKKTSKFIEFLLLKITSTSFSKQKDSKTIFKMSSSEYPIEFSKLNDETLLDMVIDYAENDDEILNSEFLENAINEHPELLVLKSKYLIENQKDKAGNLFMKGAIRWLIMKALQGFAYLRWFLFMTKSEEELLKSMFENYPQVKTFVFHMMDTEYFFPGDGDYSAQSNIPYSSQINNMKELINKYPNKLKGFVAYNPKRDKGIEVVENALNEGFTGIKFYPPLGYNPVCSMELFQYCSENSVPVFTHCTPTGFEAKIGYGKNANPHNWEKVLEKAKKLKLCLGHAGGVKGWFENFNPNDIFPEDAYAKKVVELCTKYENVYTEVGFLDEIENERQRDAFVERLQYLFRDSSTPYNLKTKIMYGSDWHVLMNHKGGLYKNYALEFIKLFNREEFVEFENLKKHFFHLNAEKFLV